MPKSSKFLLIGSAEAYSGKSAIILGLAYQLQNKGLDIAYGKPLGTCSSEPQVDNLDEDVRFIAETLKLSEERVHPTFLSLSEETVLKRIASDDTLDYRLDLKQYLDSRGEDLVLLEGPGTLDEGTLFDLSLPQVADILDAAVILVSRYNATATLDVLLAAKQRLGDRLLGVLINSVPEPHLETVHTTIQPFLEKQGISVLGVLPRNTVLQSVSVGELVRQLKAEVLCRPDRLDLMVESLTIGAMNVNSALKYFRKAHNMAVVTGGDRTDLQLAALETSTHCLILTGHLPPSPTILSRADDLEVPILSVDLDTLTTVEIIDRTFGQVRLHEPVKVQCIRHLMEQHFDIDRLTGLLGLETVAQV